MSGALGDRDAGIRAWRSLAALVIALGLLVALIFAARADSDTTGECKGGTKKTVEVGIVKAIGCWTEVTKDGATIYTGRWEDQAPGIDLNGFLLTGKPGGGLRINTDNGEVKSLALSKEGDDEVQLNSVNWPLKGEVNPLGSLPIKIGFVAPESGEVLLEDLHLGSNSVANALAGLSPIGTVETPVRITEEGKGSMDLTILLGGVFSLKNKPQSTTVFLPTESEKGTRLDGFEIFLKEIDTFKVVLINRFKAVYSAAKEKIAGTANLSFPFSKGGKNGFGGSFALEDGILTELLFSARNLEIPIGEPPAGFVTAIGGGFEQNLSREELTAKANLEADVGAEVPTPWGKTAPVTVNAALQIGSRNEEFFFVIRGGVKVFRLSVGDVYLAIYGDAGVTFGVGLGIGLPSYRDNPRDPFYIGAGIDGWVAHKRFQLEGKGRVALFGAKIFDGRVLVNDRAAGACWRVLGFPGGAVYPYGTKVKTFGVGCGLDHYKEKFPGSASVSAGAARSFRLAPAEKLVTVKGAGSAPRFRLRSASGRVLRTPTDGDASIQRQGYRHAFFVNEETDTTHVVLPRPAGRWTILPYPGSAAIAGLKAAREAPRERVTARVRGHGVARTLEWDSLNRAHTRLLFLERLPGGREIPVFQTDRPRGSRRFRVHTGSRYGRRQLRVVVIHGYGSRQSGVVDRYRVARPRLLPGPARINAWRDEHDVRVAWSGVRRARGYLVQVSLPRTGKRRTSFVRSVGAGRRSLTIPRHPGGGRAVARVFALNRDGRPGRPARTGFATNPAPIDLAVAVRRGVKTAERHGGHVRLRSSCPMGRHCQVVAELRRRGRRIGLTRFQQTPDTFRVVRLAPASAALRRAIRGGGSVRVNLRARRTGGRTHVRGGVTR